MAAPPVFLVADGLGGHVGGGRASQVVIDEFSRHRGDSALTVDVITESFGRANDRIHAEGVGGTTVTGMAVVDQEGTPYWLIFNIGDSRVYRAINGVLQQISVDHSVVQEMVDDGTLTWDLAAEHPDRHVVTRAVGLLGAPQPDYWMLPVEKDCRFLLCSDGVTSELPIERVATIVIAAKTSQAAAQRLVAAAESAGGRDNATAVVVDVISIDAAPRIDLSGSDDELTRPRSVGAGR